jgi:hypothetical protein
VCAQSLPHGNIMLSRGRSKPAAKEQKIEMSEQRSFWQRIFGRRGSSSLNQRQERVLNYIIGRMGEDARLQEVLKEEFVRRYCSQAELERIISSPQFIEAARKHFGESFRSEELRL